MVGEYNCNIRSDAITRRRSTLSEGVEAVGRGQCGQTLARGTEQEPSCLKLVSDQWPQIHGRGFGRDPFVQPVPAWGASSVATRTAGVLTPKTTRKSRSCEELNHERPKLYGRSVGQNSGTSAARTVSFPTRRNLCPSSRHLITCCQRAAGRSRFTVGRGRNSDS